MILRRTLYLFIFSTLALNLFSQKISTDRPDQTESSTVLPYGKLQLESGLLVIDEGGYRNTFYPTTLFRYGLMKGVELRFLSQLESVKNNLIKLDGISDLEIGTKIQLYQKEDAKTEVAFLAHLVTPSGTDGLSGGSYGVISRFLIAHPLKEDLALGYNLGYNNFGEGNGDITYTLSLAKSVNDKVGVYIEPFGEYQNIKNFEMNFDAGLTYLLKNNMQMDLSFGTGITSKMNYISVGFSWMSE